jgi:hypothetical protein
MTNENGCIFYMPESDKVIPIRWEQYQRFMDRKPGEKFPEYAGERVKTARINVEMDRRILKNIHQVEFGYTAFDAQGALDLENVESFIRLRQAAMEAGTADSTTSEYRRRHFWEPSEDQFKFLMRMALKEDLEFDRSYSVEPYSSMPKDHSEPVIDGMCNMIDSFPGLRVVGNNFSLDSANVTFDVTDREGLISVIFLTQARKLPLAENLNLLLYAPNNDMRFVLEFPRAEDPKKVSVWVVAVYQKRLEYRDRKKG